MDFIPGFDPDRQTDEESWWFGFHGDKLLMCRQNTGSDLEAPEDEEVVIEKEGAEKVGREVGGTEEKDSQVGGMGELSFYSGRSISELGFHISEQHFFGTLNGRSCFVAAIEKDTPISKGLEFVGLRNLIYHMDEELFMIAGRAIQILRWMRDHAFCSRCGNNTAMGIDERVMKCSNCGYMQYPRVSPAIICAVVKDNELLLARSSRFKGGFYSVLAGFVEPGETLEQCVKREIMEEVGIEVTSIRYFGSQSWPFPNSLMIGFTTEWKSGEIHIDEKEIIEAGWFSADNIPNVPRGFTISGRLIDWFRKGQ